MKYGLEYAEQELPCLLEPVGTAVHCEDRCEDQQRVVDFSVDCPKIRRKSADIAVKQVLFFKGEGIGVPWL
jgi:hypothetical protein